jgi:hypothetical protein
MIFDMTHPFSSKLCVWWKSIQSHLNGQTNIECLYIYRVGSIFWTKLYIGMTNNIEKVTFFFKFLLMLQNRVYVRMLCRWCRGGFPLKGFERGWCDGWIFDLVMVSSTVFCGLSSRQRYGMPPPLRDQDRYDCRLRFKLHRSNFTRINSALYWGLREHELRIIIFPL